MTAHKHAEILKAYADNTDLVIFLNDEENLKWIRTNPRALMDYSECEFFACLPKHNENGQCLHWLNGGEVQNNIAIGLPSESWIPFCGFNSDACEPWSAHCNFMRKESNFRIKPRKEKRWIATCNNFVTSVSYPTLEHCKSVVGDDLSWQFHEIEVEI